MAEILEYSRLVVSALGAVSRSRGTFTENDWIELCAEFKRRASHGGTYTQLTDRSFEYVTTGDSLVVYRLINSQPNTGEISS